MDYEQISTEMALAAAKRFEELFQNLPVACVGFDVEGYIREWNRSTERLLACGPERLFGCELIDVLGTGDGTADLGEVIRLALYEGATESFEWTLLTQDAKTKYLTCALFPIHGATGDVTGGILCLVDMTAQKLYEQQIEEQLLRLNEYSIEIEQSRWELEEANNRLAALAATDGLTGLLNHRAFQDALAKEVLRAQREGTSLSLVLMDVDKFKQYNDTFGHPAGDQVLKKVASSLLSMSRGSDTVARYGGEEFVAILPGADSDGALILANRMRAAIEESPWDLRAVTASFGVATLDLSLCDPATLIAAADKALYASKAAGRNCVTHIRSVSDAEAA